MDRLAPTNQRSGIETVEETEMYTERRADGHRSQHSARVSTTDLRVGDADLTKHSVHHRRLFETVGETTRVQRLTG
jgi:hypothetical protein